MNNECYGCKPDNQWAIKIAVTNIRKKLTNYTTIFSKTQFCYRIVFFVA